MNRVLSPYPRSHPGPHPRSHSGPHPRSHPQIRPNRLVKIPENYPIQTDVITNNHLYNMIIELHNEIKKLKKQIKLI
jgi:hypothetical protein